MELILINSSNRVSLASMNDCTGCGLCAKRCPAGCISMRRGIGGFEWPSIDESKCMGCGECVRSCPALSPGSCSRPSVAFAACSNDDRILGQSTSGGATTSIARAFFERGGVVYGAASDGAEVEHIRVDSDAGLSRIRGSKYSQSTIKYIYDRVAKDLSNEVPSCFIGTPCQVDAVRRFASGMRADSCLWTVDLVCGGVGAPGDVSDCLRAILPDSEGPDGIHLEYRHSNHYVFDVYRSSERLRHVVRWKSPFLRAFDLALNLRPCCYHCRYAMPIRVGDVTIGDFWGISRIHSRIPIRKKAQGVSLCLPNTARGFLLVEQMESDMLFEKHTVDEAERFNPRLRSPIQEEEIYDDALRYREERQMGVSIDDSILQSVGMSGIRKRKIRSMVSELTASMPIAYELFCAMRSMIQG